MPSVTTPLFVTPPGVATVCANAGKAATIQISIAKRTEPIMGATQAASCRARQPSSAWTLGGEVSRKPTKRQLPRCPTRAQVTAPPSQRAPIPGSVGEKSGAPLHGASERGRRPRRGCFWPSDPPVRIEPDRLSDGSQRRRSSNVEPVNHNLVPRTAARNHVEVALKSLWPGERPRSGRRHSRARRARCRCRRPVRAAVSRCSGRHGRT